MLAAIVALTLVQTERVKTGRNDVALSKSQLAAAFAVQPVMPHASQV